MFPVPQLLKADIRADASNNNLDMLEEINGIIGLDPLAALEGVKMAIKAVGLNNSKKKIKSYSEILTMVANDGKITVMFGPHSLCYTKTINKNK